MKTSTVFVTVSLGPNEAGRLLAELDHLRYNIIPKDFCEKYPELEKLRNIILSEFTDLLPTNQ